MTLRTAAAVVAALALWPAAAPANETDKEMSKLAAQIGDALRKEDQTAVVVDVFTETGGAASSAGPLIQGRLMGELKKLKFAVSPDAPLRVTGEYYPDEEGDKDHLSVKLECRLRKKGRAVLTTNVTLGYKSNEDLVKLLTMSVDLTEHIKAEPKVRNEELKKQYENPPAYTENNKVQVRKDSTFAVEVLAAPCDSPPEAFKPRPGRVEKNQTFVALEKGEEYRLLLCNTSKNEVAVTITIDGVDAFEFYEPAAGRPGSFLVGGGTERLIKGWKFSATDSKAFLVGSLGEGAAAKLYKPSTLVGTITVSVYPSWEKGKKPPEYEGSRDAATGIGRKLEDKTRVVQREFGPLLQAISIRYKK